MIRALYPHDGDEYDEAMRRAIAEYQAWETSNKRKLPSPLILDGIEIEEVYDGMDIEADIE